MRQALVYCVHRNAGLGSDRAASCKIVNAPFFQNLSRIALLELTRAFSRASPARVLRHTRQARRCSSVNRSAALVMFSPQDCGNLRQSANVGDQIGVFRFQPRMELREPRLVV
jgi:hypothetical protein